MLLHPLAPDVRCPACGAALAFLRVRRYGDLYQCPCKHEVLHYVRKEPNACGYTLINNYGRFDVWVACGVPAAEKE
jgi:hypothetical protein